MNETLQNGPPQASWERVVNAHQAFHDSLAHFLQDKDQRVAALRQVLRSGDRLLALSAAQHLELEEKKQLLPEWAHLARCAHGPFSWAWNMILSLPRDWVLEHLPTEVDAILGKEEWDDYWMFLQLYLKLDPSLTKNLADRAAKHSDPDIRELGEEYLQKA